MYQVNETESLCDEKCLVVLIIEDNDVNRQYDRHFSMSRVSFRKE